MRGISNALIQRIRRADPTARIMIEAAVETAADLRQRYDQWVTPSGNPGLDSIPTNIELLSDGGVRLKATGAAGPQSTITGSQYISQLDTGATAPFFDQLRADNKARIAVLVNWKGSESDQVELTQIQADLNPQHDTTKPLSVTRWACQAFAVQRGLAAPLGSAFPVWELRSLTLGPVYAPVVVASGLVTFDFTNFWLRPRPKLAPHLVGGIGVDTDTAPYMLILFWGLTDPGGALAANVALNYDNAHSSVVSAAGSIMRGTKVQWSNVTQYPGPSYVQDLGASSSVPAVKIVLASHTSDTVTFSDTGHTNHLDLGASIPKAQIELTAIFDAPPGTSVTPQVLDDGAVWRTFADGQTLDTVTGFASANYQTLKIRATLTTNSAGDRSPILRALGAAAVTITDLSDVAWVPAASWGIDPLTHIGEIPTCTIQAIHDGERDFRDAISTLLSQHAIGSIKFRLWCGDRSLAKAGNWMRIDDFLIDDYDLVGPSVAIQCVSALALVRGALPRLSSKVDAYPVSDTSNPGAWTKVGASSGANPLAEVLADNNGGGNNLLPWQPATYAQSVVNPANAEFTVALQSMSPPATPIVGQVIISLRCYLNSGTSLTLTVYLMEGATQRYSQALTVKATTDTAFTVTPDVTSLAAITDWTNLRLKFRANGTGQIRVTWARLTQLPVRAPLRYSNAKPVDVVSDLLGNQVTLPGRYRGPGFEGVPGLDTGTTIVLAKTIDQPIGGATDLTIAKQELDAVGFIAGAFFTTSQGRILAKQLFDVAVDAQGIVTYTPKYAAPPIANFPMEEIAEPIRVTPGYRYRVPEYFVNWGFNPSTSQYQGEARGENIAALTGLGVARIIGITRVSAPVAQWIPSQGLANGLAARHITMFGLGLLLWRFRSEYAYPELELGDLIAIRTDRFVAYDPLAAQSIAGNAWVVGFVAGVFDIWGRDLAIWVPTYSSIIGGGGTGPKTPDVTGVTVGDLIANGNFEQQFVNWQTQLAGAGVSLETGGNVYLGSYTARLDAQNLNSAEIVQAPPPPSITQDGSGVVSIVPLFHRVIPGATIKVVGVAKILNGTARTGAVNATFYGVDGTALAAESIVVSWSAETTFTAKSGTIAVPANAYWVSFSISCTETVSGTASLYIDEVHAYFVA